jgi:hypothetical protein
VTYVIRSGQVRIGSDVCILMPAIRKLTFDGQPKNVAVTMGPGYNSNFSAICSAKIGSHSKVHLVVNKYVFGSQNMFFVCL